MAPGFLRLRSSPASWPSPVGRNKRRASSLPEPPIEAVLPNAGTVPVFVSIKAEEVGLDMKRKSENA